MDFAHLDKLVTDWFPFVLLAEAILLSTLVSRIAIRRSEARAARRGGSTGGAR